MDNEEVIIKVSSKSEANKLAGFIVRCYEDKGYAKIRAIGAGAVNNAIKACTIAKDLIKINGYGDVALLTYFENVKVENYGNINEDTISAIGIKVIKINLKEEGEAL